MARALAFLLGVVLLVPADAESRRCAGGSFVIEPAALVTGAGPAVDAVVIDGRQVSLAGCGPARMHVRRARGGMVLHARWQSCEGVTGAVRLKARIDRGCGRMTGVVRARQADGRWSFLASRLPVCGNGIREGDEACDEPGACCSATCTLTGAPGCAAACATDADCDAGSYCDGCGGGTCRQRPDACVGVLEPVCGCDGRTWVNACEAARAGVGVRAPGHCAPDGCVTNDDCGEGHYCAGRPGQCDAPGTCRERPDACPRNLDPVCGCDGQTYPNACTAAAAGVRVADDGACDCAAILCPNGSRPVDTDGDRCPDDCRTPCRRSCDCYGTLGREFPAPCPLDCASCDNYWACEGGFCAAHCGPVPPGQDQCEPPPGCTTDADCGAGEFCAKEVGDCAGRGRCRPRPGGDCIELYAPVCGCDGQTYGNTCKALTAGVNVASFGPCSRVCGTIAGIACPEGQLCDLEPGLCHTADAAGVCVETSDVCPELYHPVCGCDGHTYGNDCERRAHKVQKAYDGPCCALAILCAPGTAPVDTDGDGCVDSCGPACTSACDCYAHPFTGPSCLAACPTCGPFWLCEAGGCVERCGRVPPDLLAGVCPR